MASDQAGEHAVDQLGMVAEDHRAGRDAVNQEGAGKQGRRHVPRNSEGQQRNQVRADDGAVGGFRRRDPLEPALAELLGAIRRLHCRAVAEKAGEAGAQPGNRADHGADHGGAGDRAAHLPEILPREGVVFARLREPDHSLAAAALSDERPLDLQHHLGEGEEADGDAGEGQPVLEFQHVEGEPRDGGLGVDPDQAQENAERRGDQALDHRIAEERRDEREGEDQHAEQFRRPHLQRQHGERRGHQDEDDVAEGVAGDRGIERRPEGLSRLALAGQRMAVESRRGGLRGSGRVQQDGGYGASELAALVDAEQEGDRRQRAHVEGEGNGDRDRHRTAQPRNGPDHDAEHDAEQDEAERGRRQRLGEARKQAFHRFRAGEW